MSLQAPYFGKRPPEPVNTNTNARAANAMTGNPPAAAPVPAAATPPMTSAAPLSGAPVKEGGSKLTVGPNIKLKGVEITDCDTLVVEGTVEATMDSRVMHITEIGAFNGAADIDFAEIHGEFKGDLTVRQKLVIYSTGKVSGKIRYGKVVIQEGGQLMGDIQFGSTNNATKVLPPPKADVLATV